MTSSTPAVPVDPKGLEAYFTDVEHLRDYFQRAVAAPVLDRRLLVIHGVGGIGKSSLLAMFRLYCKREHVPVALASGDKAKSAVDVLSDWNTDLKADNINLPSFAKTLDRYRNIQARVEDQSRKMQESLGKVARGAIETAASTIPGLGPVVGKLGGIGAEAMIDWLRGFLSKPDIDLLLDPSQKLTEDFLNDVSSIAAKRHLVLMLDTFEQMTALDDWARDLAQKLHPNVLFVLAGRAMPDWKRTWPEWLARAHVEELKPMTKRVMHELVRRYYATMRGGQPDPKQVDAIIEFARGLPMVVNSAVQLWVQYGVEDFQGVKSEVVADLVERLREGVPETLYPMLEAAATLRWFDKEVLQAVTGQTEIGVAYDELRHFPFVRARAQGYALHDAVREMIEYHLRLHDRAKHRRLHSRAAVYFEAQPAVEDATIGALNLERLYHSVCADEKRGIELFQSVAEESSRHRLIALLRVLLNDIRNYWLERESSRMWLHYYEGRLFQLEMKLADAEKIYRELTQDEHVDAKLRAYTLCDLGRILRLRHRTDEGVKYLETSLELVPLDSKLAFSLLDVAGAYRRQGEFEKSLDAAAKAKSYFVEVGDEYGQVHVYNWLKYYYIKRGIPKEARRAKQQGLSVLMSSPLESSALRPEFLSAQSYGWVWFGWLNETEKDLRDALEITNNLGLIDDSRLSRNLGYVLGMQGKYDEAYEYFDLTIQQAKDLNVVNAVTTTQDMWLQGITELRGNVYARQGLLDEAENDLQYCLTSRNQYGDSFGLAVGYYWLAMLRERRAAVTGSKVELVNATINYQDSLELRWVGNLYFECGALTGLVRVKYAQSDYKSVQPMLDEAKNLAQQYEYNDHLASLFLTHAHMPWDNGLEASLYYYKTALVYALRYNRFLLDEVLWGGNVATPLQPIIPHCLEHGKEGRQMLMALCDWWQTGINDIGTPRPDTISPIPEGITLLEAERLARQREPGDGSPQMNVVDKIEEALAT